MIRGCLFYQLGLRPAAINKSLTYGIFIKQDLLIIYNRRLRGRQPGPVLGPSRAAEEPDTSVYHPFLAMAVVFSSVTAPLREGRGLKEKGRTPVLSAPALKSIPVNPPP